MGNREYYTFAEMLVVLRREYIRAYVILEKMKNCIEIDSSVCIDKKEPFASFKYDMRLLFSGPMFSLNPKKYTHIVLDVNKKSPFTLVRKMSRDYKYHQIDRDSESYLFDLNCGYFYAAVSEYYIDKIYIPEDKKEEFFNLLGQLQQLDIWNAKVSSSFSDIYLENENSKISIDGLGINYSFCKGFYDINYSAKDDLISYSTKDRMPIFSGYSGGLKKILGTKIPNYSIPDDYLYMIEKSKVNLENGIIIDDYLRRRATLSITKEDGKELVLSKIIK